MGNLFESIRSLSLYSEPKKYHGIPVSDALATTLSMAQIELGKMQRVYGFSENPNPFGLNEESLAFLNLFIDGEITNQMKHNSLRGWYDDRIANEARAHYTARYEDVMKASTITKLPASQREKLHEPLLYIALRLVETYFSKSAEENSFQRNIIIAECQDIIEDYKFRESVFATPHADNIPKQELFLSPAAYFARKARRVVIEPSEAFVKRNKIALTAASVFIGIATYAITGSADSNGPQQAPHTTNTPAPSTLPRQNIMAVHGYDKDTTNTTTNP